MKTDKQPRVRPECHTKVSFLYVDMDPEKQDMQAKSQRVKVTAKRPYSHGKHMSLTVSSMIHTKM